MKIRNHRKKEWWFSPHKNSSIKGDRWFIFKTKSSLMRFLNANFEQCLNGTVRLEEKCFNSSGCIREWFVWYNDYVSNKKEPMKIVLKQQLFRGSKYIFKPSKISKGDKKYFAFSNKVINLMCRIKKDDGSIDKKDAEKLVHLFYKRGFKNFIPNAEDKDYIDFYLEKGIDFYHWSDRCNWLRTKTVIEYFKINGIL
jgi:hypothetical protein